MIVLVAQKLGSRLVLKEKPKLFIWRQWLHDLGTMVGLGNVLVSWNTKLPLKLGVQIVLLWRWLSY